MKIYILIVKNAFDFAIDEELKNFQDWLSLFTPFQAEFDFLQVNLPLEFREFAIVQGTPRYGLAGIKESLRQTGKITYGKYHAVMFCYNASGVKELLANWTYPNNLNGSVFIEMPVLPFWVGQEGLRILSHEFLHACHRLLWWKGIAIQDTLDIYDKEFEIFAKDGNRARNLEVLKPYFEKIAELPLSRWLEAIKQQALKLLELIKIIPQMDNLTKFCEAIKRYEGWFPGSRSFRNYNPGNLKFTPYTQGLGAYSRDEQNFCIFRNYEAGLNALKQLVWDAVNLKLKVYRLYSESSNRDLTCTDFFSVYAPASDSNEPNAYALFVSSQLEIDPQIKLKELFNHL